MKKKKRNLVRTFRTHDVVWLHALSVTRNRVRFGPQEQRNERTVKEKVRGRSKEEEGGRKKEEGRRKKEEGRSKE